MNKDTDKYSNTELDRAFNQAIAEALGDAMSGELPEMPTELSDRIDAALEDAMQSAPTVSDRSKWKTRLLAVCGAAAAATAIWFGVKPVFAPAPQQQLAATTPAAPTAPASPEQPKAISPATENLAQVLPATKQHSVKRVATEKTRDRLLDVDQNITESEPCNLPTVELDNSEQEMLASANYRIVTSEEEADAIIRSVFGRMESNIAEETYRISEVIYTYNSETEDFNE